MISWKNMDTLASYQALKATQPINLKAEMSGENGAQRVKNYSVPMGAGMDFNFGIKDMAKNFKLELYTADGVWREVSLLHYGENDTVIHTGNELSGINASKIRVTNKSQAEVKAYFKGFNFVKQ
jgi:hypothetical protein